jgi:hypothetical protein
MFVRFDHIASIIVNANHGINERRQFAGEPVALPRG